MSSPDHALLDVRGVAKTYRIGQRYLEVFADAGTAWARGAKPQTMTVTAERDLQEELPEVDLRHLRRLTDDTGIFQHCTYVTPNRELGYTTDGSAIQYNLDARPWAIVRGKDGVSLGRTPVALDGRSVRVELVSPKTQGAVRLTVRYAPPSPR